MTFPDKLPRLGAEYRKKMNKSLLTRLAQVLGWSRVPG